MKENRRKTWRNRMLGLALIIGVLATVATGMPEGIITVERRASIPSRFVDLQGIPITGRVVLAATAAIAVACIYCLNNI